jgi:hypothetical protein
MTRYAVPDTFLRPRSGSRRFLAAAILLLLVLAPLAPSLASAQPASGSALFVRATYLPTFSGLVVIHGDGFTPGGLVQIALTDHEGTQVFHEVWTVATTAVYGPNGSTDPAQGYVAAGSVTELVTLDGGAAYGPNGSQDPAQGYWAVDDPVNLGSICADDVAVQAYDAGTLTLSNTVDVSAVC